MAQNAPEQAHRAAYVEVGERETPQQEAQIVAICFPHARRGVIGREHDLLDEVAKSLQRDGAARRRRAGVCCCCGRNWRRALADELVKAY